MDSFYADLLFILQSTISWPSQAWPARDQTLPTRLFMTRPAMLKTHVYSILKLRLH